MILDIFLNGGSKIKIKSKSLNEDFCTIRLQWRTNIIQWKTANCVCAVFLQQAIRVLGLLGALDPYKHKVNIGMIDQSRDASAVSLSESKSSQDSGSPHFY